MDTKMKHVLLIDDRDDHNYLNEIIISDTGLFNSVRSVTTGEEGLNYLEDCNGEKDKCPCPDLLFLDINMPGMDGWEFLTKLEQKKAEVHKLPSVFILSTSSYSIDIERSKQYKLVNGYITKPLKEETLVKLHRGEYS